MVLDNVDAGNSIAVISVGVMVLVFSTTAFMTFPLFVLPPINYTVVDSDILATPQYLPLFQNSTNSSSSSSDSSSSSNPSSVSDNLTEAPIVSAYLAVLFILVTPLFIGNWRITNRKFRIIRILASFFISIFYSVVIFMLVQYEIKTNYYYPFFKAIGYFTIGNSLFIVLAYLYVISKELIFPQKISFRTKRHRNLVKRLLQHTITQKHNKTTGYMDVDHNNTPSSLVNKIKSLFADKKKNPHKIYEQFFDMFFPQRLIYSTLISLIAVLDLSFIVSANLIHISRYYIPIFWDLCEEVGLCKEHHHNTFKLIQLIVGYASFASFLPWLILLVLSILLFINYRNQIFKLRQGKYERDTSELGVYNASKFLGRQVFVSMISYFILAFVMIVIVIIVVLCIFVVRFRNMFVPFIMQMGFLLIGSVIITFIVGKILGCIFLDDGVLKNRRLFFVYDYISTALYLITGLIDALKRFSNSVIGLCLRYPRMDVSTYPGDLAYLAYRTLLYTDHHYNNPILNTFVDLLIQTQEENKNENKAGDKSEESPLLKSGNLEIGIIQNKTRTFKLARNKWHVARTLIENPSLIKFRKHWKQTNKN